MVKGKSRAKLEEVMPFRIIVLRILKSLGGCLFSGYMQEISHFTRQFSS
jgi:hypothetical protein